MNDLSVTVTADTDEFVESIEEATEAVEELQAALEGLEDALGETTVTIDVEQTMRDMQRRIEARDNTTTGDVR